MFLSKFSGLKDHGACVFLFGCFFFALKMMMLQNGFVMGGIFSSYDHFRDLRLNVDNMTYEVCVPFSIKYL